jgi:dephospho-CoA kinase
MPITMPTKRLVIALTGPIGSGVTTVSNILAKNGFHRVSMSSLIREELKGACFQLSIQTGIMI